MSTVARLAEQVLARVLPARLQRLDARQRARLRRVALRLDDLLAVAREQVEVRLAVAARERLELALGAQRLLVDLVRRVIGGAGNRGFVDATGGEEEEGG